MELKVGQQFRVTSAIAQTYEQQLGPFRFIVEIYSLESKKETPTMPAPFRDISFTLLHWEPNNFNADPWYACHCITLGHDRYGKPEMNYSPDLINGQGEWFLPDLFRWQRLFLYLVRNGVVEYIGWKAPAMWRPHKYSFRS